MCLEEQIKEYLEVKDVQIKSVDVNDNLFGLSITFDYYGEELSSNEISDFEFEFNLKKMSSSVNVLPYKTYSEDGYVDIIHCSYTFGGLT